jgi:hypothetical protein
VQQRLIVSCARFGKLANNDGEEHFSRRPFGKVLASEPLMIGRIRRQAILRWTWWPIVETQLAGSHVHSLVLTDIASGWTEAAALIMREQTLITVTLEDIQSRLPFPMLGLDVDNDSIFINETVLGYCKNHELELTRPRAYRKNDQAWIEQKNGAVVRKLVGYGRLEGADATIVLAELHKIARLYVNFFQPSFKLKSK